MSSFDETRFNAALKTRFLGREFHAFEFLDSTNTRLKDLAAQGSPEGVVVLAESQTAGRGRWGRHWESPAGKNLLFSFLLRPRQGILSQLTPVFGLACLQALKCGALKWPNDLWVSGRKLSGILAEGSHEALIVGVGLNVNQLREEFSPELRESATSLLIESGRELDREALLADLLLAFEEAYARWKRDGFAEFQAAWDKNALFIGENVRAGDIEGKVLGLDSDGALKIQGAKGVEKLHTGEVFGLRPMLD